MAYQFDHHWEHERERLAALEAAFDPVSQRSILAIEPQAGWQCLEVGGGGGSMAKWLCDLVGPEGLVVATDLETKFLETIDARNLEVREHDIVTDPLEEGAFHLVHSRAVLDHIPQRDEVVHRLIAALRPGGWLALDGGDFSSVRAVGAHEEEAAFFDEGFAAVIDAARAIGFDPQFGRRLGPLFRSCGLAHVVTEGAVFEWRADDPLARLYSMTFARLRENVVESGVLPATEFDRLVSMMTSPTFAGISNTLFAARGRRAAPPT